jgi:hypothetical protein
MKKLFSMILVICSLLSGNAYSEDNYFIKTAKEFNREFIKAETANEAIYHMQKLNQMLEDASIIADRCYTAIMDSRISYSELKNKCSEFSLMFGNTKKDWINNVTKISDAIQFDINRTIQNKNFYNAETNAKMDRLMKKFSEDYTVILVTLKKYLK